MSGIARTVALALALLVTAPVIVAPPAGAVDDLKIALVVPPSGRWARQGQLKKMGAEMAIEEINAQGGIKALGGAKIVLREADAGDSVEKAVSAAQRILTREKISAGIGSWLSSFTLGVTEVAERLQVPWLTLSYADSITERGFKYTFQTSPVSSAQAEQALDHVDLVLVVAAGEPQLGIDGQRAHAERGGDVRGGDVELVERHAQPRAGGQRDPHRGRGVDRRGEQRVELRRAQRRRCALAAEPLADQPVDRGAHLLRRRHAAGERRSEDAGEGGRTEPPRDRGAAGRIRALGER